MKLQSLWIDGYKNIINTNINFSDERTIAIIGNNGTGKSNLIEALLNIFVNLYYGKYSDFKYLIKYEAHGKQVEIHYQSPQYDNKILVDENTWSNNKFAIRAKDANLMPPFPAMVFGYYSGTCERMNNLFKSYKRTYFSKLRNQSDDLNKSFIFSDIEQSEFILLGLLAHEKSDFLNEISIDSLNQLEIILQPSKQYDREKDDPVSWGLKGAFNDFLSTIARYSNESKSTSKIYEVEGIIKEERKYVFNQEELVSLGQYVAGTGNTVYNIFQAFDKKGMVRKLGYSVLHKNRETVINFDDLSEGEKQLISVIGGLWLNLQNECLILLDEPDTHLNPSWSWKYHSLLNKALESTQRNSSTVLIATHDPVLISGLSKEQVLISHRSNEGLTYTQPHRNPRGQGVANVLTSEFFGLPSSLDKATQELIDERLLLAYKENPLSPVERERLQEINIKLQELGLGISYREEDYKEYEKAKYEG